MTPQHIDPLSTAGYATGAAGIIFGLTIEEIDLLLRAISVLAGVIGVVGTLWLSWHFKNKNYKLNTREKKHRKPRTKEERRENNPTCS